VNNACIVFFYQISDFGFFYQYSHFSGVNCASFAVSAVRKRNVLVTKGVLDKVKHMTRNPDPTTRAM